MFEELDLKIGEKKAEPNQYIFTYWPVCFPTFRGCLPWLP